MGNKLKRTFLWFWGIGLAYHMLCYMARSSGHWDNDYNIPGFFIAAGSMPWSLPLFEYVVRVFLKDMLGPVVSGRLFILVATLGFAVNATVVRALMILLFERISAFVSTGKS